MNFGEVIIQFFSGVSVTVAALVLIGLILAVIEIFYPMKRIFLVTGLVMVLAGITVRMLNGGTAAMLFFMLMFPAAVLLICHIFALRFLKRQWLYQSLRLSVGTNPEKNENYEFLMGLSGTAASDINDEGSMAINDITFFVCSERFIERGCKVRVTAVDGEKIFVTKQEND